MDPEAASEAGAELIEAIKAELGPGWTKLSGIAGVEKGFVIWDNNIVALASKDWSFYLIEGKLWSRVRRGGNILTGRYHEGDFEVVDVAKAPDASLN